MAAEHICGETSFMYDPLWIMTSKPDKRPSQIYDPSPSHQRFLVTLSFFTAWMLSQMVEGSWSCVNCYA